MDQDWTCPHCKAVIGKITLHLTAAGAAPPPIENVIEVWPKPIDPPEVIRKLADNAGGTIDECALLPDGSGFATMSMPLPKDHWLFAPGDNIPPMPFRVGEGKQVLIGWKTREELAEIIRAVGRYAYRANTGNGKFEDQDPDAFLQNLVVGFLGYWTASGLSSDPEANPK